MRPLMMVLMIGLTGCTGPYWIEHEREDAKADRQYAVRDAESIQAHNEWWTTETRHLLAICLDIAKFEKQWTNYDSWRFSPLTRTCKVSYKKNAKDKSTPKECSSTWLWMEGSQNENGTPSLSASDVDKRLYWNCVSDDFSREWIVPVVGG